MSSNADEILKAEKLISFAISFLTACEPTKKWKKITGNFVRTCGYTGPGIGLLLQLFDEVGVFDIPTLTTFLQLQHLNKEQFMDIVNETIGNFLDVMPFCPVTGTEFGMSGLLHREKTKQSDSDLMDSGETNVYKVEGNGSNLVPGANVISFTSRTHECDTIHHAVLYIIPALDTCYIIDSWSTSNPTDFDKHCRPLVSRPHHIDAVYAIIDELNYDTISPKRTLQILSEYFLADNETIRETIDEIGQVTVHTIKPSFILDVYIACRQMLLERGSTSFGGKTRKRNKNCGQHKNHNMTSRKRSKKYNRRSNRKHKIYRRTPVKNKKV